MTPPPITWDLTIGGVSKPMLAGSLNIRRVASARSTATFQLDSLDRSYRAPLDAEVSMTANGALVMAGLIDRPHEQGLFKGSHPGIRTSVNVVDFWAYTEWRHVRETFPEQTLKARFQAIVTNYLADYGVTLHASQADGPLLPSVTYDDARVDAVIKQTLTLTADAGQPFVASMSFTKVLRAYQPSTVLAPFNLVENNLTQVVGDVTVEKSNDGRANKVIVKVAPKETPPNYTESWTYGTDPYPFELKYTPTEHFGHLTLSTGGGELMGVVGTTPTQWELDTSSSPATLTRTAGTPTVGTVYTMMFKGFLSGRWEATDPSWTSDPTSRKQKVITLESIRDGITGQAFADAELAKSLQGPIFVKYTTLEDGIEPGQQQTIDVPARDVNADGVIGEVNIRDKVYWLEYHVSVVVDDTQTNLDRTFDEVYRIWAGDRTGAGSAPETGGEVISSGPAPPFTAVQFNRSGAFGGDASFTFLEAEHSIICGDLCTITAADFDGCVVVGYNNHIADP